MPEEYMTPISGLYDTSAMTVESMIHECTQIIERSETVAGAGRRMRHPMLSVFLGRQAVAHINEIQEAYFSCWSDHARHLKILRGAYTRQDIEEAIFQSTQTEDRSLDAREVRTVWFWDIMDDNFDTYFTCVKEKYSMPVATGNKRMYFVFCSQRDSEAQKRTKLRLEQLIQWAKENEYPLVVLSDATGRGLMRPSGIAENYRLAANLMLIMNTKYSLDEDDLGSTLTFDMCNEGGLFSASYHGCSKNFFDIVSISLLTIIQKYRALGQKKEESYSYGNSVQDRLCGKGNDYCVLLDKIFDEILAAHCKADVRLWRDMPHTEALTGLRQQLTGTQEKQGFLSKLFGGKTHQYSVQEVVASLGGFWSCSVDRYFTKPIVSYLETEQGQKTVKDYMYGLMTSTLNYDEMHELLQKESETVMHLCDDLAARLPRPNQAGCRTAEELLQQQAVHQAKAAVAKKLLLWLSEAMATLCANAAGFDELLGRVEDSLSGNQMERSVELAYGSHMSQLIALNSAALTRHIRPSRSEADLLVQLKQTFEELVAGDSKRVYQKSLQGDLQFRIENGGAAAAVNVIADCFRFDMTTAGRIPTLEPCPGKMYTIMNNALGDLGGTVADEAIGNRFIINRSDRIERLYLFRLKPELIIFSNDV